MAYRDKDKQRAAGRAWYHRNKIKKSETQKRRRADLRRWFEELKRGKACLTCGEADPVCLNFHHRDPDQKEIAVADAVRNEWSNSRLLAEIAKCDVLCANCHAKRHFEERFARRLSIVRPERVHKKRRPGGFVE